MQVPPTSSASQLASAAAQASGSNKDQQTNSTNSGGNSISARLEKSEEANADRDAQGQGDGIPDERPGNDDELDIEEGLTPEERPEASNHSGEDSDFEHLDIVG